MNRTRSKKKKVRFVENTEEDLNADGVRGHLEVVSTASLTSARKHSFYERVGTYSFLSTDDGVDGVDGGEVVKPVYSFNIDPAYADMWTQIEGENPGQLIYAYGSESELTEVGPKEEVVLPGKLVCTVDDSSFVDLDDNDLKIKVTGCAIRSEDQSAIAYDCYQAYLSAGGE